MWMRNTIAPLDMVFINADGTIRSIAENTVPQSLAVIDSRGPVRATLELAAGTTARLNIRVGDKVQAADLRQRTVEPCLAARRSARPHHRFRRSSRAAGRGAAWSARLFWVQEVVGSNPAAPTNEFNRLSKSGSRSSGP